MNRLGGDVVRKIAHVLSANGGDKDVFHLALTCGRLHYFLVDHLRLLSRIYSLADYNTWPRITQATKMIQRRKKDFICACVRNLLPPSYSFMFQIPPSACLEIWPVSEHRNWEFHCDAVNSIQVKFGRRTRCWLFLDNKCHIDWAETIRSNHYAQSLYPQFESILRPILDVYPALIEALFRHFE
jgi:hypothetical protein